MAAKKHDRHIVCAVSELPSGARTTVEVGGRSICVLNVDGRYFAVRNTCPHQGGPLCRGTLGGTMLPSDPYVYVYGLENRILRCPWHGWEFDLETGHSLHDPEAARVAVYPVSVEDGVVVIDV